MKKQKTFWPLFVLPPFFFVIIIFFFSFFLTAVGISEAAKIEEKITENIPIILLFSQIMMLAMLFFISKKQNFPLFQRGWKSQKIPFEVFLGVFLGAGIAFFYFGFLSKAILFLQNTIGDYVPAGELIPSLGKNIWIFFVANVLLAPFVEENIYRNIGLINLLEKYGIFKAVFISAIFFGILHWMGGFWYLLSTGLFLGVPFALISLKRKNIILVFAAHLTLNIIEFIVIANQ